MPRWREGQSGIGDPDYRRPGQGLSGTGVAGLSRRQARQFHDAQHEHALQRFDHREHRDLLCQPTREVAETCWQHWHDEHADRADINETKWTVYFLNWVTARWWRNDRGLLPTRRGSTCR